MREVARTALSDHLHAIGENLNAEKLGQLVEEAKVSVSQLIMHTKKQLALEQGRDEEEVEDDSSAQSTEHSAEEHKATGNNRESQ